MMKTEPVLASTVAGIALKNPVMTASGTFGYGREYADFMDLSRLGAIVVKGLHVNPAKGNPPPRIVETACGMLNAIGLENVGIRVFIQEKLPYLSAIGVPVIANIYGHIIEEYTEAAAILDTESSIAGVEVNISCPNIKEGGVAFGVRPESAHRVIAAVRGKTTKPVIAKLSPNVTDVGEIARSVEDAGADAVSLINTVTGMAVDIERRRPKLANITGGLSGPAIKPIALRMVWQAVKSVSIPVIGIGGIMTARDAIEFLMVGAGAIQVGTANFINPRATIDIIEGIEAFMTKNRIRHISEIIGSLQT